MKIIDSHCHIHEENFPIDIAEVFELMRENSIKKAICVGVNMQDSLQAVKFAEENSKKGIFAAIGVHPHDAKDFDFEKDSQNLENTAKNPRVVAIGEIGLDYHYNNSPKEIQAKVLTAQLKIAKKLNLPVIFHVRDAFDDFWQVLEDFEKENGKIRGVVHSFTDNSENLKKAISKDFYIGVNGISTFVKKPEELEMFSKIPLKKILIETDAPFLAPKGKRGKPNQPAWTKIVAEDIAEKRKISVKEVCEITSGNSEKLFNI